MQHIHFSLPQENIIMFVLIIFVNSHSNTYRKAKWFLVKRDYDLLCLWFILKSVLLEVVSAIVADGFGIIWDKIVGTNELFWTEKAV